MADKNTVLKLGIDTIKGNVSGEFSAKDMGAGFVEGLRELNGGSSALNIKTFHRGNAVFEIIEEMLPYIVNEALKGDEFFMNLVDERNLAEGDLADFYTEDNSLFLVSDISRGVQGIRRQRLNAGTNVTVPTKMHAIKVYEELRRLMAGRVDFGTFIDRVSKSYINAVRTDIYNAFNGISASTAGLSSTYVETGSYTEADLVTLIEHVEAATGKSAVIFGTKTALRKVTIANSSADSAKEDLYNVGYYGRFNGTPMVCVKQVHAPGTDTFVINDSKIWIIAADDKPIKYVTEGTGLLLEKNPMDNADLTQEYMYGTAYGIAVICNEKLGVKSV